MTEPEALLQRITITIDIDHEPGYEYVATGALLDVLSHLAHDGIEPPLGHRRGNDTVSTPTQNRGTGGDTATSRRPGPPCRRHAGLKVGQQAASVVPQVVGN